MTTPYSAPQNLLEALTLFIKAGETAVRGQSIANLKTSLRKYILPNLPRHSFCKEDLEGAGFEYCLSQITLSTFIQANSLEILAKSCQAAREAGTLHPVVERTTYRPALNKFLNWLKQENWYEEASGVNIGKFAPKTRYGTNIAKANRGRRNLAANPYGLKEPEITPKLHQQLDELCRFCTGQYVPHRRNTKMRKITFQNHKERSLDFLGWLKNIKGWKKVLKIELIENIELLNGFLSWGIDERGNTSGWAQGFCETALNVAKWRHCHESKSPRYRDIKIVEEIRMIKNDLAIRYEGEKKANKRKRVPEKEMTMEQCIEIVKYLRKCCATRDSFGAKRSGIAVLRAWLRYLIIAILTYCPVRQREIRELEINRTLFREPDGYRVILLPDDNKTGDERDFKLSDMLAPEVVTDLDEWFEFWQPQTNAAIKDLDSWLGLVNRRQYKTGDKLNDYINNLQQVIQQAEVAKDYVKLQQLQKQLESAQKNYETLKQAQINFRENLVFISLGTYALESYGGELSASGLFTLVTRAVYSASAALQAEEHPLFKDIAPRRTNPHFFRNIAITHERRHGDPSKRKAFHKVLGNSEKVGDEVYNEMHPSEKTVEAKEWWKSEILQGKPAIIAHIKASMMKLSSEERRQLFLEFL